MENNELKHWGIKGMKWGVRRYQNADGSLTPAGKKRYERDIAENKAKKKDNRIVIDGPDVKRWVMEDTKRSKRMVDTSSDIVKELKKISDKPSNKKRQTLNLSNMSDKQLRDQINRTMLERQYNEMFAPQEVSKGKAFASKTLEAAGTALQITSSALAIALAIKELAG